MICRYGCTKVIISDQGREFVNQVSRHLFKMTKTEHRISSAYHPQTNGLVERFNQTVQRSLVKLVNSNQTNWDEKLDGVLFAYRTAQQKSTQVSPFELMYCRKAVLPIEAELGNSSDSSESECDDDACIDHYVRRMNELRDNLFRKAKSNIDDAQLRQKRDYDKKHAISKRKDLELGALVLLRNSVRDGRKGDKLNKRWLGPYRVEEVLGKGVYQLANPNTGHVLKKAVNGCRLKRFFKRSAKAANAKPLLLDDSDIFQLHSPESSFNTRDDSISPLPPSEKGLDSHVPVVKKWRISDFVLHAPSSTPQDSTPLDSIDPVFHASFSLEDESIPPLSPPMPPLDKLMKFPNFFPDNVVLSPIKPALQSKQPEATTASKLPQAQPALLSKQPEATTTSKLPQAQPALQSKQPETNTTSKLPQAQPAYDRERLLSDAWLTDKEINEAHKMLAKQFPAQHGLQDTLILDKVDRYASSSKDFVQVINVSGNHWVCTSNLLSPPGMIYVYDSLPVCSINSHSLHRQIATIVKSKDAFFVVKHVAVQHQFGRSDCGVFAIAFATSLCMGIDPHTLKYEQTEMRPHLLRCFEHGHLSPFHTPGKTRRLGRAYFLNTKEVPVFCVCRLPWYKDNTAPIARGALVQCCSCKEWYHQSCCNIDDVILDTPKYKYLCSICIG